MAKDDIRRRLEFFRNRPEISEKEDRYDFGGISLGNHRLIITNAKSMNNKDPRDVPRISISMKDKPAT